MITVCIPAYRAEGFIGETVASVLAQTHSDFILDIAIDPPDDGLPDDTLNALAPFTSDARVHISQNARRLGWAGNINAMLNAVTTDYYVILPHDDLWQPKYLETLFPFVRDNAQVSVAYGDLTLFGPDAPDIRRSVVLPWKDNDALHILKFFLQGAHAMPWRGVTRTSSLKITGGFPDDGYRGFAVECEYALALLHAGRVRHVPLPIYRKRIFDQTRVSASQERRRLVTVSDRWRAWQRHRDEMVYRTDKMIRQFRVEPDLAMLCRHALMAAMLWRRRTMVTPGLADCELLSIEKAISDCALSPHPLGADVVEKLRQLSR